MSHDYDMCSTASLGSLLHTGPGPPRVTWSKFNLWSGRGKLEVGFGLGRWRCARQIPNVGSTCLCKYELYSVCKVVCLYSTRACSCLLFRMRISGTVDF